MIKLMTKGQIAELIALGLLASVSIGLAIIFLQRPHEIVYNCSIAEISPDFPIEVREQCRKLNAERIK